MEKVILSDEAYNEFKAFLEENNVNEYTIRIFSAGSGCSGPSFNITVGTKEDDDIVEQIKDITFLVKADIIDEYGAMTILSSEENDGMGLSLRPLIEPIAGCGGCSGCH